MKTSFYQYRSFKHTYLFTVKNSDTVNLKIFDTACSRVFKCNIAANTFMNAMHEDILDMSLITKNLPEEYRISEQKNCESMITSQPYYKKLLRCINEFTVEIFKKQFICPITQDVMKDPVTDNHGHSFEKEAIGKHLSSSKGDLCPMNRERIAFLVDNNLAKEIIDNLKQKKIPTNQHYKSAILDEHGRTHERSTIQKFTNSKGCIIDNRRVDNLVPNRVVQDFIDIKKMKMIPRLSQEKGLQPTDQISEALDYVKQKKYDKALECYSEACRHTDDWRCYAHIPALFETMEKYDSASIAYLYLIKYKLRAGDLEDAIKTLEYYRSKPYFSPFLDSDLILIELYLSLGRPQKATDLLMQRIAKNCLGTISSLQKIISEKHLQLLPVDKLAMLMSSSREKAHILCKGALEACYAKQYEKAKSFAQEALEYVGYFIFNKFVCLDIDKKLGIDIQPKIFTSARLLGESTISWKNILMLYKMLPEEKYGIVDYKNVYRAYVGLDKIEKATECLLRCTKKMGDKRWDFSSFYLTGKDFRVIFENIPKTLESLTLELGTIVKIRKIKKFIHHLPDTLRTLALKRCNIGRKGIKAIAKHIPTNLQLLDITGCIRGDESLKMIMQCLPKTLRSLILKKFNIGNCDSNLLFKNLPENLLSLNVADSRIGVIETKGFASNLPKALRSLNMNGCYIQAFGTMELAPYLPKTLRSLNIGGNSITDEGLKTLIQYLPAGLRTLDLSNNGISHEGAKMFAAGLPRTLLSLNLNDNRIGDKGMLIIAKCIPKTVLSLALACNALGDKGVKALVQYLPENLLSLDLNMNKITSAGIKELAVGMPKALRSLYLGSNHIGDDGMKMFAQHLPNTIQSLILRSNNIESDGAKALAQKFFPALRLLDLSFNTIENSVRHIFRKKYRSAKITFVDNIRF